MIVPLTIALLANSQRDLTSFKIRDAQPTLVIEQVGPIKSKSIKLRILIQNNSFPKSLTIRSFLRLTKDLTIHFLDRKGKGITSHVDWLIESKGPQAPLEHVRLSPSYSFGFEYTFELSRVDTAMSVYAIYTQRLEARDQEELWQGKVRSKTVKLTLGKRRPL